jgi:hypothetical protein
MDESASDSCPVVGFGINGVSPMDMLQQCQLLRCLIG